MKVKAVKIKIKPLKMKAMKVKEPKAPKPKPVKIAKTMKHKGMGKVAKVMKEFSHGELHSGSKKGPKVTNPKQALAIGYSEQRRKKKK